VISITDGQLYLDIVLFGTGVCPAVSIDKSVSRVGAKSLDGFFRMTAFRIYALLNDYKQELDTAVKSDAFKIRSHRYSLLIGLYTQRSSTDRFVNMQFMHSLTTGALDMLSPALINSYAYCLYSVLTLIASHSIVSWNYGYQLLVMLPVSFSLSARLYNQLCRVNVWSTFCLSNVLEQLSVQPLIRALS